MGNIGGLINSQVSLGSGITISTDLIHELALVAIFLLLILPIVMITALILSGDQKQGRVLHVIGWNLALGASMIVILIITMRSFWLLWGAWLCISLANVELFLEVKT